MLEFRAKRGSRGRHPDARVAVKPGALRLDPRRVLAQPTPAPRSRTVLQAVSLCRGRAVELAARSRAAQRSRRQGPRRAGTAPTIPQNSDVRHRPRWRSPGPHANLPPGTARRGGPGGHPLAATRLRRQDRARAPLPEEAERPRPPAWSQTQAATTPRGWVTRAISRSPMTGSAMK